MAAKERLDVLLVQRGLVESRNLAQRLVMAGQVRVDGQMALKPGAQVPVEAEPCRNELQRFVVYRKRIE